MGAIASQITSLTIIYSIGYSDADQRKHHSSASLAFMLGIHRGPVNSPHKWPEIRKMSPFDDVIMCVQIAGNIIALQCRNTIPSFQWNIFGTLLRDLVITPNTKSHGQQFPHFMAHTLGLYHTCSVRAENIAHEYIAILRNGWIWHAVVVKFISMSNVS